MFSVDLALANLVKQDPQMKPYLDEVRLHLERYVTAKAALCGDGVKTRQRSLSECANGHMYFGFHRTDDGWVFREWLPGADSAWLCGDFNGWERYSHPLKKLGNGVWEITLDGRDALKHEQFVKLIVGRQGSTFERIPAYIRRAVQDQTTHRLCGQIWAPDEEFVWTDAPFRRRKRTSAPRIYEAHVGMAQETPGVGSYTEFADKTLDWIAEAGYNTIQLMAIAEHPYYASFGYQVTNFFAPSHWFGTPDELKYLINRAHEKGIAVLMDVVHSHASPNEGEGLHLQDGTDTQYFHAGARGWHPAWETRCFDYGRGEVLHFLLSNLKFWLTEYHFDGFRFDGVTSMLYHDHGLGSSFGPYERYFSMNTDTEAVTYLQLANELIKEVNPRALSIAEDTSAMPGLALPIKDGGIGFDYRLAMGTPDLWIKLLKEVPDEHWDMWQLYNELSGRRPREKVIGYAESHDQALVGDKTIMFRLCDQEMYWSMNKESDNMVIDRGIALHKMIRLITMSLGGDGYLNFMGNEFGHPEWIDFPREGNGWSYHYCRRQWSLANADYLKYHYLQDFDVAMVELAKKQKLLEGEAQCRWIGQDDKTLVYERKGLVFAFNFHPTNSLQSYFVPVSKEGKYKAILTTDEGRFGGHDRVSTSYVYEAKQQSDGKIGFMAYLPSRTAMVLKRK